MIYLGSVSKLGSSKVKWSPIKTWTNCYFGLNVIFQLLGPSDKASIDYKNLQICTYLNWELIVPLMSL